MLATGLVLIRGGGFTYKELADLLKDSDYVSVNIAEAPETVGLLNEQNLGLIQPGAILISTVPPPIINTDALANRLSKNDITFISDHPDEMPKEDLEKIRGYANYRLYPPIAFVSDEATIAKQEIFISNVAGYLEGSVQNDVAGSLNKVENSVKPF
jgi:phosphoglycerate dehydrogenase-like enzyme